MRCFDAAEGVSGEDCCDLSAGACCLSGRRVVCGLIASIAQCSGDLAQDGLPGRPLPGSETHRLTAQNFLPELLTLSSTSLKLLIRDCAKSRRPSRQSGPL